MPCNGCSANFLQDPFSAVGIRYSGDNTGVANPVAPEKEYLVIAVTVAGKRSRAAPPKCAHTCPAHQLLSQHPIQDRNRLSPPGFLSLSNDVFIERLSDKPDKVEKDLGIQLVLAVG